MDNNINLLTTKFSINHIYRLKAVGRSKLFEILNDSVNSRLTFINAPAGFGKTTLLSSWITMCKKKSIYAAWLTLDEEDNDESRFWRYFAWAIKAVIPNMGEKAINLLKTARVGGMETVITVLINEIQETKKKFIFIIEDIHVIKNEEILNSLKYFMNHMPGNIHILMTSRRDISSVIQGIKDYESIIEIGQEELRFTYEETTVFINEIMKLNASEEELIKLYELTEGWPAGLQLVALSCKRKGIASIKDKKSMMLQSQLENYFIEDVLNTQSTDIYEFLIKTSLLGTFSYDLCVYITGIQDCRDILNRVLEMNLFMSCLDDKENWYRYHNLFSSFIKKKIEEEQPDMARKIYMKAGEWYENMGYKQEAGTYYLKGKNYEKAVILIEEASTELIYHGQLTKLEKWIEGLPARYLYRSPKLMLDYVWIHLSKYKVDDARYYIEMIEKIKREDEPEFEGEFLIAKAFVSMDDLEQSIDLLKRSLELTDSFNPNYPAALMSIATSYITHGEVSEAEEYYLKALAGSKKIENLYSAAYSWGSLGMMMTCQGRFSEAEALYKEAEEYLEEKGGKNIPLLGIVFSGLSEIYYYRNQIEKAYKFSSKAAQLFERGGIFDIKNNCYAIKARSLLAKGNKSRAIETIDKAMSLSEKDKVYGFKRHMEYSMARMFLDMNDLDKAIDFIQQYNMSPKDSVKKYNLHDYILLAEILVKTKKFERGISCIEEIMKTCDIGKLYEVQLRILKADALLNSSEPETAYDELHKALMDCAKENYIRLFINYGSRIQYILQMFIDNGSGRYDSRSREYAEYILTFFNEKITKKAAENNLLTNRELQVLKLISKGASNEEIAKVLFISVSTVKSHTLNIFGKLEVNSRSKAVIEAEKRGIILD